MQVYDAPVRDMKFVYHELNADDGFHVARFDEVTPDLVDTILDEANKIARGVLLPINASGDIEGCRLENGVVRTPKGFPEAWQAFHAGGWNALQSDPAWGGQGLPEALAKLVEEMVCATNVSFSLYPGLTHGATTAIEGHAAEDLKRLYLPKMNDGSWAGTMCLTEAHCGTDLGLLRTRAAPQGDGSYVIDGAKIFISAGDHDLAENVIHLVLARIPDGPPGVKGISLFIVPKYLPNDDGSLGNANGVSVSAIEHKMGMKASVTCQLNFDGAKGWLVGEPHKGLAAMFTMMNTERVSVGVQGLGLAEAAYQGAVFYAKDRVQGRSLSGQKRPDLPADPIIVHPDVRRMLMTMRATAEGCRALTGWVSRALDAEKHAEEPETRRRAGDFVALMTPVVKALLSDMGYDAANLAVQTYGGHGYIREHGMEQHVRDARIAMIYEGTNGIQALDLVGRKLPFEGGRYLKSFLIPVGRFLEEAKDEEAIAPFVAGLAKANERLQAATMFLAQTALADPEEAGAASVDYLRLLGLTAIGYQFAKAARIAAGKDEDFYRAKLATARFFFDRMLPQTGALLAAIRSGKASMMALDEAAF